MDSHLRRHGDALQFRNRIGQIQSLHQLARFLERSRFALPPQAEVQGDVPRQLDVVLEVEAPLLLMHVEVGVDGGCPAVQNAQQR